MLQRCLSLSLARLVGSVSVMNENGDVGAHARRGHASRLVGADVEAILAALDCTAASKARYVMHASDSSAIGASGVSGQEGQAASTATPQVLGNVNALIFEA